jgi:hypothetical protein
MRYIILLLVLGCFACASPESRADKLAKSLCGCTTQLLTLNQQAQTGSDSLSFRKIGAEFEKAKACAAKLGIKPEDRASLELALKTQCPALAGFVDLLPELLGE